MDNSVPRIDYDVRDTPTVLKFLASTAFIRGIRGPVGSGKSTGMMIDTIQNAQRQVRSPIDGVQRYRAVILRNTYGELETTTIRTFHQWWRPEWGTYLKTAPIIQEFKVPGVCHYEWLFLALDRPEHVRKLLSLEVTDGLINEAREMPKAILDALTARVGRYPGKVDGGPVDPHISMDTNSPDQDHWWAHLSDFQSDELREETKRLEAELLSIGAVKPGQKLMEFFTQPSAENPDGTHNPNAENLNNLPPGYYLKAKVGKTADWIKVYIRNEYHFVMDGKQIYDQYRDNLHCMAKSYNPNMPLHIGMDFGLTPAAVFFQRSSMGQVRVLSELVATHLGAKKFAREIKEHLALRYGANPSLGSITGDPAGEAEAQTDETTPFQMLASEGIIAKPAHTNDPKVRIEAVNTPLSQLIDGEPALVIHPDCKVLRKACAGGYHYRRIQIAGESRYDTKPNKNQFSHVAEGLQYGLLGVGVGKEVIKKPDAIRNSKRPRGYDRDYDYYGERGTL